MMRHPIDNPVFGSPFGPRKAPTPGASTNHLGQDYRAAKGTPVRAIADGVISDSFRTGPGGWWVHLRLDNGDVWGGCHLREKSPYKVGKEVKEGDVIAYVGNTGTATTGPHLHATTRVNGEYVDPRRYIDGQALSHPTTPKPEEEDDMYTDEDRARDDETRWLLGQIKPKVDEIHDRAKRIEATGDVNKWALTDSTAGLRQTVATILQRLGKGA